MTRPVRVLLALTSSVLVLGGCGGSKSYDISTIFPASDPAEKCQKYDGDLSGSGINATCMVTKDECEKAAADWREAMRNIDGAILFSCD